MLCPSSQQKRLSQHTCVGSSLPWILLEYSFTILPAHCVGPLLLLRITEAGINSFRLFTLEKDTNLRLHEKNTPLEQDCDTRYKPVLWNPGIIKTTLTVREKWSYKVVHCQAFFYTGFKRQGFRTMSTLRFSSAGSPVNTNC